MLPPDLITATFHYLAALISRQRLELFSQSRMLRCVFLLTLLSLSQLSNLGCQWNPPPYKVIRLTKEALNRFFTYSKILCLCMAGASTHSSQVNPKALYDSAARLITLHLWTYRLTHVLHAPHPLHIILDPVLILSVQQVCLNSNQDLEIRGLKPRSISSCSRLAAWKALVGSVVQFFCLHFAIYLGCNWLGWGWGKHPFSMTKCGLSGGSVSFGSVWQVQQYLFRCGSLHVLCNIQQYWRERSIICKSVWVFFSLYKGFLVCLFYY